MRRILASVAALGLLVAFGPSAAAGSSDTGPLVQVSGPSPFADCSPARLDEVLPQGVSLDGGVTAPQGVVAVRGPAFFARSSDRGANWQRARRIFDPGPNRLTTGNHIVVLPNGALANGFTLLAAGTTGQVRASVAVIRSTQQGVELVAPDDRRPAPIGWHPRPR